PNTNHLEDLVYYEGPLITLKESGGEKYVWVWVDVNDVCNRWGVFKTTEDKVNNWREKEFVFDFISEAVEEGPVYFVNIYQYSFFNHKSNLSRRLESNKYSLLNMTRL
ncbi:MAG: hypothetical protein ACK55I_05890, partial [bacterium]